MGGGRKCMLMILDGWGLSSNSADSAIAQAKTPFIDSLSALWPNSQLLTHGGHVGLPEGQMGNSEVGHLNLGAGRVVEQDLVRINRLCSEDRLIKEGHLQKHFEKVKEGKGRIHFIGLLSNGGIHSHIDHLEYLVSKAEQVGIPEIFIHAFTDGRDTDPFSGLGFVKSFEARFEKAKMVSVMGRYFGMDRDQRWERTKKAYDALINGVGRLETSLQEAIQKAYSHNQSDEFLEPIILDSAADQSRIKDGDTVLCFNFRTDRCRQISRVLVEERFPEWGMNPLDLHYYTLTSYDKDFKNVNVVLEKEDISLSLGEVVSNAGKSQVRIAETEKYPHVTYFFSGGREDPFPGEDRIMVPSPKVATYDLRPQMSIQEVKEKTLIALENDYDFLVLNFANPDMVGHTGNFEATVEACTAVDSNARDVVNAALARDYAVVIIADHGNAEMMRNPDGTVHTAHTTNPVPIFLINYPIAKPLENGILADVAPSILKIMGIESCTKMTGRCLFD